MSDVKQAWEAAAAAVKTLRAEMEALPGKIEASDFHKLEALLLRQQILPALVTAAQVEEERSYALLLEAQIAELQPELAEKQAEVEALKERVEPLQAQLTAITAEALRLDARIRDKLSEKRAAKLRAENLQVAQRERAVRANAPYVKALNYVR